MNNRIEFEIKHKIAECFANSDRIDDIVISQKYGFIDGLVETLESIFIWKIVFMLLIR